MTKIQKALVADAIVAIIIILILLLAWPADAIIATYYTGVAAASMFVAAVFFYVNLVDIDDDCNNY